jgi:hypothetical protein
MDYTLVALLALIVLVVVFSTRQHRRTWAGRPGYQYQRVITLGIAGLWLTGAGALGLDFSHGRRIHWTGGPIWWQVGVGLALIGGAVFFARRMPPDATRSESVR